MKTFQHIIPNIIAAALAVTTFVQQVIPSSAVVDRVGNPIPAENQNPGDNGWRLDLQNWAVSDDVNGQIQGYASKTSVQKGGNINFHITVNPTQTYTIDIYRLGWYGGKGGRLMKHVDALIGSKQPDCPMIAATGLTQCNWAVGYTLNVPITWTTGVYVAMLTNQQAYHSQIEFVVRDDNRNADLAFQLPVITHQAYNAYPESTPRGKSLYGYNSSAPSIPILNGTGSNRAVKVSFDRPGGLMLSTYQLGWEYYLLQWLEREGYDVSYITDIDAHKSALNLFKFKGVIATGHDEYWTKEMFNHFEQARNFGVDLAFTGANDVFWQVRLEDSSNGVANRVIVCYKDRAEAPYTDLDPIKDQTRRTTEFRLLNTPRPEQTLIGVQYSTYSYGAPEFYTPHVVANSHHWAYSGTGLVNGSSVAGIVGYEVDKLFDNYAKPISISYTTLSNSPFTDTNGIVSMAQASIYQAPSGAWVFGSGSMGWSWALAKPGSENAGIQQTMRNILNRFVASPGVLMLYPNRNEPNNLHDLDDEDTPHKEHTDAQRN